MYKILGYIATVLGIVTAIGGFVWGLEYTADKSLEKLKAQKEAQILNCTFALADRQMVLNNYRYKKEIKEDYRTCMSANTNRDVVYNDTNELAKTCLKSAYALNSGLNPRNNESYVGDIERSLRHCGELK